MAKPKVSIEITAVDKATAKLREIGRGFEGSIGRFDRSFAASSYALAPITKRLDAVSNTFKNVGLGLAVGLGAPMTAFGKLSFDVFADHEEAMLQLKAMNTDSDEAMASTEKKARDIAKRSIYSLSQVGRTMVDLNKQGVALSDLPMMTNQVLDFATAGRFESLEEAGNLLNAISTAYNIKTIKDETQKKAQLTGVSDTLLKGANLFSIDAMDFGHAFKNVGTLAGLKMGFDDVVIMMGMLGDALKKGEDAGTHAKIIMARLDTLSQVDKNHLGLNNKEGKLLLRDIIKAFGPMAKNTEKMKQVFGGDAFVSAQALFTQGLKKYDDSKKQLGSSADGTTTTLKNVFENSTKGLVKGIDSKWEEFQMAVQEAGLKDIIVKGLDKISSSLDVIINKSPDDQKKWFSDITTTAKYVGIGIAGAWGFTKLVSSLVAFGGALFTFGGWIGSAVSGMGFLATQAGILFPALSAVGGAIAGLMTPAGWLVIGGLLAVAFWDKLKLFWEGSKELAKLVGLDDNMERVESSLHGDGQLDRERKNRHLAEDTLITHHYTLKDAVTQQPLKNYEAMFTPPTQTKQAKLADLTIRKIYNERESLDTYLDQQTPKQTQSTIMIDFKNIPKGVEIKEMGDALPPIIQSSFGFMMQGAF